MCLPCGLVIRLTKMHLNTWCKQGLNKSLIGFQMMTEFSFLVNYSFKKTTCQDKTLIIVVLRVRLASCVPIKFILIATRDKIRLLLLEDVSTGSLEPNLTAFRSPAFTRFPWSHVRHDQTGGTLKMWATNISPDYIRGWWRWGSSCQITGHFVFIHSSEMHVLLGLGSPVLKWWCVTLKLLPLAKPVKRDSD